MVKSACSGNLQLSSRMSRSTLTATAQLDQATWRVSGHAHSHASRGLKTAAANGTISDEQLINWFLQDRVEKETTRASYHSQLVRLHWFCLRHIGLRSIREFQREDFDAFKTYLSHPPKEDLMTASVGRDSPLWRPFRCPLQPSSVSLALTIVRSFYEWMAADDIGALARNPLSSKKIRRQRVARSAQTINRYLTPASLSYIDRAIGAMATTSAGAEAHQAQARARWIIYLATHTGLRASEISRATSGMITPGRTPGTWSLNILRKGDIESAIPLLPELMQTWAAYKKICSIPNTPATPLVCALQPGRMAHPLSRKTIWEIAKTVFHMAAKQAHENNDEPERMRLEAASTHWLRHTFGTTLMDSGADIRSARDLMDHSDISTTSRYTHIDDAQRINDLKRLESALRASQNR